MNKHIKLSALVSVVFSSSFAYGQNPHIDAATGKYKFWFQGSKVYLLGDKGAKDSVVARYDIMINYNEVGKRYVGHVLCNLQETDMEFQSDLDWKASPNILLYALSGRMGMKGQIYEAKLSIVLDEKTNKYNLVNFDLSNYKERFKMMFTWTQDRSGEYEVK